MKKTLIVFFFFIISVSYPQTLKVNIDAACVSFSKHHNKAFVAVRKQDNNYPNSLLQLDPYSGVVEKNLPLNGNPIRIRFTPDYAHMYVSYDTLSQIDKIDLTDFQITGTIQTGEFSVLDFAILPSDENTLFVILGHDGSPDKTVMFKDGVIQPKQIDDYYMSASYLCIKNDGTRLYGHNGNNTGFQGYLIEIVEDGIVHDDIGWEYMISSFGEIKNLNDLIFGRGGVVVDPFTDSIPLRVAQMPLYKLTDGRTGFDYSVIHGCYIFGHETNYKGYISFFHGQYYNYLGSLQVEGTMDNISDVDVVDENHFILVAFDTHNDSKNSLLFYSVEEKKKSEKNKIDGHVSKEWFENNLIKLPVKKDSTSPWQLNVLPGF